MKDNVIILIDALLITIAIFLIGNMINRVVDNYRLGVVLDNMNNDYLSKESLFLQNQLYILSNNKESFLCKNLLATITSYKKAISKYGDSLDTYGQVANSYKRIYQAIEDDYFISQLYFYNSIIMLNKKCNANIIPIIFIYKPGSEKSLLQGYTLENLEKINRNIFVISIGLNFSKKMGIGNNSEIIYNKKHFPLLQTDSQLRKDLNISQK